MKPPTPSVNDTKKKTVKAWAILLYPDYDSKDGYMFGISIHKGETKELYKKNELYKPDYKIIGCTITYSI